MKKLLTRIDFYTRVLLTLLWLVIAVLMTIPLIIFQFKNPKNNHRFGSYYGPIGVFLLGFKVKLYDKELMPRGKPAIYVFNHQSAIDLPVFASVYPPNTVLIGKKELRFIPFFGLMYEGFGNILIDRKNRSNSVAGLNEALEALRADGLSVYIFPEGTRNTGEGLLPFKKGAFYMAVQAQVPIVPVVGPTYRPYFNWKERRLLRAELAIRVLPPIETTGMTVKDVPELLERTRNEMLNALADVNQRSHLI